MRPLFAAAGHTFYSPSYTGLGERAHLARPDIDLSTHIQDVLNVLEFEDLKDVVLLGHSYGGMVATGVADKARARIQRVVYIDAFAPKDGQSLFDLVGPKAEGNMRAGAHVSFGLGTDEIEQALSVLGRESIDIDHALDARARLVGDAGRDHAAIGMAQQNDVLQVLELKNVQNVLDVR